MQCLLFMHWNDLQSTGILYSIAIISNESHYFATTGYGPRMLSCAALALI